jgi:hypothetical protein
MMQNMSHITIDALPLLFQGGISNYTRPLTENLILAAGEKWHIELVFREAACDNDLFFILDYF